MKWRAHETVAQYVQMVQQNQIFAVAAGVVVHQHTRVLMADLHERGDDMSVADVQAGMQQLTAELAAAYKAAAVGDPEIRRVVEEYKSGPQGKATVGTRVAEANARLATTLCDCAVCGEAAARVRSRVGVTTVAGQQRTAVESSMGAEATGAAGTKLQSSAAQVALDGLVVDTEALLTTRRQKERDRKNGRRGNGPRRRCRR